MTDKEMAEEYAKGLCKTCTLDTCRNNTLHTCAIKEYIKQAHLAGLKAGRPKWHDLREAPNDLPNGDRVVLNQVGMATRYDPNRGFLGLDGIGVIAWCEIPKYTEE